MVVLELEQRTLYASFTMDISVNSSFLSVEGLPVYTDLKEESLKDLGVQQDHWDSSFESCDRSQAAGKIDHIRGSTISETIVKSQRLECISSKTDPLVIFNDSFEADNFMKIQSPTDFPLSATTALTRFGGRRSGDKPRRLSGSLSNSEGYSTCSSDRSWSSWENCDDSKSVDINSFAQTDYDEDCNWKFDANPQDDPLSLPLPPLEYMDDAPNSSYSSDDLSLIKKYEEPSTCSDFFSHSSNSSTDSLLTCDDKQLCIIKCRAKPNNNIPNELSISKQESGSDHTSESSESSHSSSLCSPSPKRKRIGSPRSDERKAVCDAKERSDVLTLNFEKYCNEYAGDTFLWLRHQEATTHVIGASFMTAQKLGGAVERTRRAVIMKAIIEMRARKHTNESIHLGAYILDKCLDSFHVADEALADVCAVSMVLATKIEEYDSLRPCTVEGLAGATKDKLRLCRIEKRIIYELDGKFCFPTPFMFANYMLAHLHSNEEQIRFTYYILDLALLRSQFRDEGGARVAHAAVCISCTMAKKKDSPTASECQALIDIEQALFDLTKLPAGSTRAIMRELLVEMSKALIEKHPILENYLTEDTKRLCFSEISMELWRLICGAQPRLEIV